MTREEYERKHEEYLRKLVAPLVGGKIVYADLIKQEGDDWMGPWITLLVEKDGKMYRVQASQDEEGNGPGHLFVDDVTETAQRVAAGLEEPSASTECVEAYDDLERDRLEQEADDHFAQ